MKQNNRHTQHTQIKKRPDLSEVVKSLRASGRHDVANTISELLVPVAKVDAENSKFRFAYLYVNNAQASMDDQSRMLHSFIQTLRTKKDQGINAALSTMELIPVTLPKGLVVLAMRLYLDEYLGTSLPVLIEKHAFMKSYLRKPRSDTQYLAQQAQVKTTDTGPYKKELTNGGV